ncbi:hypothetical protein AHMF7605_26715 [Adhaeribacter arboris]|uniref:Uncharacterized protein n=2 Tax=Adhaeribacter arboris TaxID=2072846 RepID=A0A2T2YMT9_9BACT|nr:hypothetical protein AHMF7605_26715 [Adhaeribacter arboris]
MLISNEVLIKDNYAQENSTVSQAPTPNQNTLRPIPKRSVSYAQDLKNNRESIYPYFLLSTGLLVFLLVLPKLSELSFSPTSGFTLKVLQDVQEVLAEAKTAALALEAKSKQTLLPPTTAEALPTTSQPNIKEELKKLEESLIKLETYSRLLENKISKSKNPS